MNIELQKFKQVVLKKESGDRYVQLLSGARKVAAGIIETSPIGLRGSAGYIHRVSSELANSVATDAQTGEVAGAAGECLQQLMLAWPKLSQGLMQGEQILADNPMLWKRAMMEWPMGSFAAMTAEFMIENKLLDGHVLELGAGIGSCSTLVAGNVGDGYIRSDLQPFLLKRQRIAGSVDHYDFNLPGHWKELDTIFAVNALHCAKDKVITLGYLFEMLRAGGMLVLGEGAPHTDNHKTPWALNGFFGMFRGWWDIGGFLSREDWLAALDKVGFRNLGSASWCAGSHDLGGVIWAQK